MAIDVDPVAIAGIWGRHLPHKAKVYYLPEHPADGRWNRGCVTEAWYFADTPETAWAEWYRVLAEQHLRPEVLLPRDLWRWAVDLSRVADLGTSARLARVGLGLPPPQRNSWPA